jgi:hypothetical protein
MTTLDSIRERVRAIEDKLADGTMEPATAREFMMALTGVGGPVADEVRRAEMVYNHVLLAFLSTDEAANRAKIRAQCSPEYNDYKSALDLSKQIQQLIISTRGYLRSLDSEAQLAR